MRIRDLSLRCWVEKAFRGIGGALGNVSEVDATETRVLVSINVTKPLRFKKKVILDSGETVTVSLSYEKLYRYCFTCFMISHEERDCPFLFDHQRQSNKERRVAALPVDGRKQAGGRGEEDRRAGDRRLESHHHEERSSLDKDRSYRAEQHGSRDPTNQSSQKDNPSSNRQVRRNLYLSKDYRGSEVNRNFVWQRIGEDRAKSTPRSRETSIQSSSGSRRRKEETAVPKTLFHGTENQRHVPHRMSSRRRESPLRIRSPAREEPSRDFRRSSRRPPRHNSNRTSTDFATNSLKNKGKGKLVDEEDAGQDGEEDDDLTRFNKASTSFDVGYCSGTCREEEEVEHRLQLSQITKARPEEVAEETPAANMTAMVVDEAIENGLSDWTEEEYPEKISNELNGHKLLGLDFVPSDWEKMVDEELAMESDKEITEEGLRLMQELEN